MNQDLIEAIGALEASISALEERFPGARMEETVKDSKAALDAAQDLSWLAAGADRRKQGLETVELTVKALNMEDDTDIYLLTAWTETGLGGALEQLAKAALKEWRADMVTDMHSL